MAATATNPIDRLSAWRPHGAGRARPRVFAEVLAGRPTGRVVRSWGAGVAVVVDGATPHGI